jgi:Iron-containing redox enzyme
MTTIAFSPQSQSDSLNFIQPKIESMIDDLVASLPDPKQLTSDERRGIIARYSVVLEGNFIYWMTAAYISVQAEEARPLLLDNLHEEVRDAHPEMLRRFTVAAHALPTDSDAVVVHEDMKNVRLFLGRLSGVQSVMTMAFFEGFIQKFMGYLADLAAAQGSVDMEYTDVHGVCDIAHTQGLFQALSAEMAINPLDPEADPFEGAYLLRTLLQTIIFGRANTLAA